MARGLVDWSYSDVERHPHDCSTVLHSLFIPIYIPTLASYTPPDSPFRLQLGVAWTTTCSIAVHQPQWIRLDRGDAVLLTKACYSTTRRDRSRHRDDRWSPELQQLAASGVGGIAV